MPELTLSPGAAALAAALDGSAKEIISRYPEGRSRSALLPLLHLVQAQEGHVSPAGVEYCAAVLGITKAQVGAVATFYTMYKRRPAGDWLVSVCTNTLCNVMGGQEVYDALVEHLGVGHDETTADGITLEHAECLAACDYAPVMTVNYEFFDQARPESAVEIVQQLRGGQRPMPTRGARLCTFKEAALQLAGYADERDHRVLADGPAGEPSLRGNRLAEEHGISVAGFDPSTPIRRHDDAPSAPPTKPAPASTTGRDVPAPDRKSPQVRAAETRNPDAQTAVADSTADEAPVAVPENTAEAAGAAAAAPASDGKPAGDAPQPQEQHKEDAR